MSTEVDRQRILERIKKCMALSKSSEPHEAAAAMRQAQAMMKKYEVDEQELLGIEVKSVIVVTPFPFAKRMPMPLSFLGSIVQRAFGVDAITLRTWVGSSARTAFKYYGVGARPELAAYAHDLMWRQMNSAWNTYREERPHEAGWKKKGARTSFWIGWLYGVESKVMDFGMTDEEKAVLARAIAKAHPNLGEAKEVSKPEHDPLTLARGHEASKDFSIHRPMTGHK